MLLNSWFILQLYVCRIESHQSAAVGRGPKLRKPALRNTNIYICTKLLLLMSSTHRYFCLVLIEFLLNFDANKLISATIFLYLPLKQYLS